MAKLQMNVLTDVVVFHDQLQLERLFDALVALEGCASRLELLEKRPGLAASFTRTGEETQLQDFGNQYALST